MFPTTKQLSRKIQSHLGTHSNFNQPKEERKKVIENFNYL